MNGDKTNTPRVVTAVEWLRIVEQKDAERRARQQAAIEAQSNPQEVAQTGSASGQLLSTTTGDRNVTDN